MRRTPFFLIIILLCANLSLLAQPVQERVESTSASSYSILQSRDYAYRKLRNEGIETMARQLDVLHVPIRPFKSIITGHIERHHFVLNQGKNRVRKTTYRAISFTYPSVAPNGEPVMLSGLVTFPVLPDNKPSRMLIYHRILAPSYSMAPTNSLPFEAVLTADNTICVVPDYYGCGLTEGKPLPFIALNYHAQCATDCALAALKVVQDAGIELADDFHTWNTGYSQGAGYALATQRYIETSLADSLAKRINLRWSLCGGGIYTPINLYEHAVLNREMGSTPMVFVQGLRSLFNGHKDRMDTLTLNDFLSQKSMELGLDTIFNAYDDGLWDLSVKVERITESHDPADYFHPATLDTTTALYHKLIEVFGLDDCIENWHPQAPVVMYHSTKDNCIPYRLAVQAYNQLSGSSDKCVLCSPRTNKSHVYTSVFFFAKLLRFNEDELYKKYVIKQKGKRSKY
ncbi:MAG: hypothetical protein J5719_03485 [Bacteroidales bacterium]|nr:hypothetical protein [Bacteroidales bacterium]